MSDTPRPLPSWALWTGRLLLALASVLLVFAAVDLLGGPQPLDDPLTGALALGLAGGATELMHRRRGAADEA